MSERESERERVSECKNSESAVESGACVKVFRVGDSVLTFYLTDFMETSKSTLTSSASQLRINSASVITPPSSCLTTVTKRIDRVMRQNEFKV